MTTMMKRYISLFILSLAVSTMTYAQDEEPAVIETVDQLLGESQAFTVFNRLVTACGLQPELSKVRDEEYERAYQNRLIRDLAQHPSERQIGTIPEHRYYGYTVFAEPDAVWETLLGKAAANITVADVKNYLINKGLYPGGTTDDNYTDVRNIVNLFTTYHILPERLTPDKLVIHYNELGYSSGSLQYTIPVEEFYTTLGQPRLLKIFESTESNGIYLNRFPVLRNGRGQFIDTSEPSNNDYHESGVFQPTRGNALTSNENQGIIVFQRGAENASILQAFNGCVYPISQLLAYTENVQTQLSCQRLRFDAASLLPEMMNNDLRRPMANYSYGASTTRGFPVSREFQYFDNLDIADGTSFYYLSGYNSRWANYQGDEFNVVGNYEFTLKLPPVPANGAYELRIGVSSGSSARSIAQFSLGSDKEHLIATELPIDLRVGGKYKRLRSGNVASNIGWEEDTKDAVHDRLVDIRLHEQGFMKGPQSFTSSYYTTSVRTLESNLRRIVWSGMVEAGKTYYLHVKNCMPSEELQFYMDYIEWCPKNVYANPETPEDIW